MSLRLFVRQSNPHDAIVMELVFKYTVKKVLCRRVPDDGKMATAILTLSLCSGKVAGVCNLKAVATVAEDTEVAVTGNVDRTVVCSVGGD